MVSANYFRARAQIWGLQKFPAGESQYQNNKLQKFVHNIILVITMVTQMLTSLE